MRHLLLKHFVALMSVVMWGVLMGSNHTHALSIDNPVKTILMLGDSLTAGYNLPASEALPAVLERHMNSQGPRVKMINGGVSGDTAAQGLARLDWMLNQPIDGVIIALGANDMLRGIDPARTRSDLEAIIVKLKKQRGLPVMLVGMRANPSLGVEYVQAFEQIFTDLARTHNLTFYPFMLNRVAGSPMLNQSDGLHPNKQGIETIAAQMLPTLQEFVVSIKNQFATPPKR